MLDIDVCERCRNKKWPNGRDVSINMWVCPSKRSALGGADFIRIYEDPPAGCEYMLEHAVIAGMKNEG